MLTAEQKMTLLTDDEFNESSLRFINQKLINTIDQVDSALNFVKFAQNGISVLTSIEDNNFSVNEETINEFKNAIDSLNLVSDQINENLVKLNPKINEVESVNE
ncbi:hypothetical protein [Companilactobacillus mishanensis]|uniref:Uncharacterized protein n=1 Tax=Companilactobacillus mishanensis TaxID=2486008 RepID=A0A5P0ZF34_9LACO|nr:hypothetical protein [Companilactobacillus mishanensis]MQS44269.1 hypothetical protein [Companilactobacillus mishanensis]MQS51628.1 hypothetical protein [Companilactobacillus mishanensis]